VRIIVESRKDTFEERKTCLDRRGELDADDKKERLNYRK